MSVIPPRAQAGRAFPALIALVALAAMAAGIWLSIRIDAAGTPPALQSGTLLIPPKALPEFTLQDQNGQPLDRQRLQGQWTLVFFGYTHCPDICPDTLAVLNMTMKALPAPLRQRTRVLFVSVDPQRDTREQLRSYVAYFNPDFIGATGELQQLDTLTRALGILYVHNAPDENGNYGVDHSGAVLLFDPDVRWRAVFSKMPHEPEKMAADLVAISNRYEEQQ